ncbi:hypothetical protein [Rhizobium sp. WYCCWR 11146]|uniref:hypothetical protein n=1 Tax=Rhizobium sp. WYCCWR 11146 TaxID=2749833 RepID=UPI0015E79F85|nr:hypothetical protein [Rhizobium sp. WYCCWR 11146]MBA1343900.1 hypothetical protein [Rhizobium sp. WYCCWR 11146]
MSTKEYAISTANIAVLQAMLDAATKTGKISAYQLGEMSETIYRELRMHELVAYLATKDILPIEQAVADGLMKTMLRADARALENLVGPYRHGDVEQMADAIRDQPLTKAQLGWLDTADNLQEYMRDGADVHSTWRKLRSVVEALGLDVALETRRIEPKYKRTPGTTHEEALARLS